MSTPTPDTIRNELIRNSGEELLNSVRGVKDSSEIQSRDITAVIQSFETIVGQVSTISHDVVGVNQIVRENAKTALETSGQIQTTAKKMSALQSEFETIAGLVKTIESLARQTNLLALNATIEAARAGESGKGFAVVANEVKALSQTTHKSNNAIQDATQRMQSTLEELSIALKGTSESIERSLKSSNSADITTNTISRSTQELQTSMTRSSEVLRNVKNSLATSQSDVLEISVIGETFDNLMRLMKWQGLFEKDNDPLDRIAPLAEASTFINESRFTGSEQELLLKDDDILISATDSIGNITFANHTFSRLAEYEIKDLAGAPHNIVRHPDMPKTAFQDLWAVIGSKELWQGIVKNKSKSGKYYWVKATVFPCLDDHGHIKGYISVRCKPSRAMVDRAIQLYRKLP